MDYMILAFNEQIVRYVIHYNKEKNFNLKTIYNFDNDPFTILPIENVGSPISIQIDTFSLHRFIYWIDNQNNMLKRASEIISNTVINKFFLKILFF